MNLKREYDAAVLGILQSDGERIAELEAERDELRQQHERDVATLGSWNRAITELQQQQQQLAEAQADSSTAWAQVHRLALELECLIMDTKDNAIVSKWWDSAFEVIEEYHNLKPGAAEDAEAWAKMRKAGI